MEDRINRASPHSPACVPPAIRPLASTRPLSAPTGLDTLVEIEEGRSAGPLSSKSSWSASRYGAISPAPMPERRLRRSSSLGAFPSTTQFGRIMHLPVIEVPLLMSPTGTVSSGPISTTPISALGPRVTTLSVVLNFAKTAMGVGILSLAGAFDLCGMGMGLSLTTACGALSLYSVWLLLVTGRAYECESLDDLAGCCFGHRARLLTQAGVLLQLLMASLAYQVCAKHFLASAVFGRWGFTANEMVPLCMVAVFPMTLLPSVDSLRHSSVVGLLAVICFVVVSWAYLLWIPSDATCREVPQLPVDWRWWPPANAAGAMNAFNALAMSYAFHPCLFPAAAEISEFEPEDMAYRKTFRAAKVAVTLMVTVYAAAGWVGYVTWGAAAPVASSILACYPATDPLFASLYVAMVLVCVASFPLLFHFAWLLCKSRLPQGTPKWTLAVTWCVATGICALLTDSLLLVLSLGGALTVPCMCYVLPATCFLQTLRIERSRARHILHLSGATERTHRWGATALLGFGCVVQVVSLWAAVGGIA
eukprot:TRINITY_DN30459_c0_g1_i1.p1 TRINITY_DN30459_c0_g1~~TRINITY_DN30459_c0_g1_i1.p1  ORF type:complete len:534 (+),score=50.81 TRINITY_DN30459_c0_g1_i1:67-1668(+)